MSARLTKPEYACLLALAASMRSTDPHSKVGAAAFDKDGYTLCTAYNGLAPGMETPEWMALEENRNKKALLTHHAEANLYTHLTGKPYLIGLTHSPCPSCAKIIAASSVKEVYFLKEYVRGGPEWKDVFDFYSVKYVQLSEESKNKIKEALVEIMKKL